MKRVFIFLVLFASVQIINAVTYSTGFEDASKIAYASGTVLLSGTNWDMTDALIGSTSGSDRFNGSKSARVRNLGTITMLSDKTDGIGTITVVHAKYGTDGNSTWQLQVSSDGGITWSAFVSSTQTTSSTTLSSVSFNVNLTGNNRVRIVKLSGGTNRINFDDISVSDYSPCATPAPSNQDNSLIFERGFTTLTLNWTESTDGTGSLVMINTVNTFSPPADGTSPTANTVYSGSGQQVVYNSSSNSVTVSGLDSGQTYYFAVFTYNCSGANTKYNASISALNNKGVETFTCPCTPGTYILNPDGDGGFESGSTFAANGWSVTNDATKNDWVLGTSASGYTGSRSAFISDDGGTSHSYDNTQGTDISFSRTIDLSGFSSSNMIILDFDWKGWCDDDNWDDLSVYANGNLLGNNMHNQVIFTNKKIDISAYAGSTVQIRFRWTIGTFNGVNPPHAIDNIAVYNLVPTNFALSSTMPFEIKAYSMQNQNIIEWKVLNTSNIDSFSVLRSKNGSDFEQISIIGQNESLSYKVVDSSPYSVTYYKVLQFKNGKNISESNTVHVLQNTENHFMVYPNPTNSVVNISFQNDNLKSPNTCARVFNNLGMEILTKEIELNETNNFNIDLSNLSNGVYFLKLDGFGSKKIVKN